MSTAAANATLFYREVANSGQVWAIKDFSGFPAPEVSSGKRAMPFWSSEDRALTVIKSVKAYHAFEPVCIPWDIFCDRWIPGLERDGLLAGVNWAGKRATGFDIEPRALQKNVECHPHHGA